MTIPYPTYVCCTSFVDNIAINAIIVYIEVRCGMVW